MVPFSFAGETFEATPEGALCWPAQQALLVADLHLEKASWFARVGQFLPPYDSHATLTALAAEVERSGASDRAHFYARLDLDRRQSRSRLCRPLRRPDRGRGGDRGNRVAARG